MRREGLGVVVVVVWAHIFKEIPTHAG